MKQDSLEPGAVYHIYNRGNNQENIFIDHGNYFYFLQLMKKYLVPVSDIFAYCLLKNHFHLLLRIKDQQELEEELKEKPHLAFSNFFNAYTKSINKKYNRTGSLFQKHLKRKRVENTNYLIQLIAYIHLNPIKHNFTNDFKTYSFSSYKSYVSKAASSLDRDYIFNIINPEQFEYWHHLKGNELLGVDEFFSGME